VFPQAPRPAPMVRATVAAAITDLIVLVAIGTSTAQLPRIGAIHRYHGWGMLMFTSTSGLILSAPSIAENGLIPYLR
jgi:hypothetical protein